MSNREEEVAISPGFQEQSPPTATTNKMLLRLASDTGVHFSFYNVPHIHVIM
jgi:hypothetical protein